MSIAPIVLARIGIMRKKHGDDSRRDKMSIAPTRLARIGIMRKKHGDDSRRDKMSIAPTQLARIGIMRKNYEHLTGCTMKIRGWCGNEFS